MTSIGSMPHLTCPQTGKQVYPTRERAEHFAARLLEQERRAYWVYPCPFCRWWHLTRKQPGRRR